MPAPTDMIDMIDFALNVFEYIINISYTAELILEEVISYEETM